MSNRLFQGVVHQMRDTIGRVIGVIDENSTIVACSELSRIGETLSGAVELLAAEHGGMIIRNSIILLDQIQKHMAAGEDPWHAEIGRAHV